MTTQKNTTALEIAQTMAAGLERKSTEMAKTARALRFLLEGQADPPPRGAPVERHAVVFGDFRLGTRSLQRIEGVHPDIMAVVQYAIRISPVDFGIPKTGGVRDDKTQHRLMGTGKSKTLRSRHLTGHAVDIYAIDPKTGNATWEPRLVLQVHEAFEQASAALHAPLRWGGDWDQDGDIRERGEDDLVHHELPRRQYGNNRHSQSEKAAAFLAGLT